MADTIEVVILARDEASKTISGIRGALGGLGSAVGTVAKVGTAAFLGVGAAAVGGFGMALRSSIGMNAQLEQSTMMFTTLMGDADKATEHVKGLFDFAAATPFETGEIIEASKHLQVFGGEALNTQENLTLIGDAAAAVGAPFDEVAFWTGRMYSAIQGGQPFGEAAMRLQELGLMTPEVRLAMEGMQEAGADASAVWGTFAGDMGRFNGAMEMQSQSWTGLTSTIKDNINMLMAEALRPFFELLKTGLASLAAWLSSPEIQAGIQQFAANLQALVQRVSEFVTSSVIPFVQQHGPQLKAVVIGLAAAFAGLLIIGAVAAAIALLTNPITWIVAAIGALAAAWTTNWMGIRTATESVINFLRPFIESFLSGIRAFWDQHGAAIMAVAQAAWGAIQAFITGAVAMIVGTAQAGLDSVRAFWDQHGAAITGIAQAAWDLISGIIEGVLEHMRLVFDMWRSAFEGDWEAVGQKLKEIWENAWNTIVDFLRGLWNMMAPIFQGLWQSISGWFQSIDWASLGSNIIDGIVKGLKNAAGRAYAAVRDIIQGIRDAAGGAAGEGSPARLFIPLGKSIADGVIEGIRSKEQELMDSISDMIKLAGDFGKLGGGFENIFSARNIDPLQGQIKGVQDEIKQYTAGIEDMVKGLGYTNGANAPDTIFGLQKTLIDPNASWSDKARADAALRFMNSRNKLIEREAMLQDELTNQQARLFRMEQARADLNFLQQQFDLLKLINDNQLDKSILDGMTFGLGADPGQLMDAMVEAMQGMVAATEREILNAAPTQTAALPAQFFQNAGTAVPAPVVVNIDARQAQPGVEQDIRRVVVDVMRDYGMRADVRMRTGG